MSGFIVSTMFPALWRAKDRHLSLGTSELIHPEVFRENDLLNEKSSDVKKDGSHEKLVSSSLDQDL